MSTNNNIPRILRPAPVRPETFHPNVRETALALQARGRAFNPSGMNSSNVIPPMQMAIDQGPAQQTHQTPRVGGSINSVARQSMNQQRNQESLLRRSLVPPHRMPTAARQLCPPPQMQVATQQHIQMNNNREQSLEFQSGVNFAVHLTETMLQRQHENFLQLQNQTHQQNKEMMTQFTDAIKDIVQSIKPPAPPASPQLALKPIELPTGDEVAIPTSPNVVQVNTPTVPPQSPPVMQSLMNQRFAIHPITFNQPAPKSTVQIEEIPNELNVARQDSRDSVGSKPGKTAPVKIVKTAEESSRQGPLYRDGGQRITEKPVTSARRNPVRSSTAEGKCVYNNNGAILGAWIRRQGRGDVIKCGQCYEVFESEDLIIEHSDREHPTTSSMSKRSAAKQQKMMTDIPKKRTRKG